MKTLTILFFLLFTISVLAQSQSEKITVEYDKFKDETSVSAISILEEVSNSAVQSGIGVIFKVPGNKIKDPLTCDLIFFTLGQHAGEWIVIADGTRTNFGTVTTFPLGEKMWASKVKISTTQLLRMAQAKKLEMKVGDIVFTENGGPFWDAFVKKRAIYSKVIDLIKEAK
jgi:hypothetical protein